MGLEKTCEVEVGGKTATAKVQLEPGELIVRGALKMRIPLAEVTMYEAKGGKLRVTRRRILDLIQLRREASEVVDRPRRGIHCQRRAGNIPVGRNAEHGLGHWNFSADRRPAFRITIPREGVHRISVSKKEGGHGDCHRS